MFVVIMTNYFLNNYINDTFYYKYCIYFIIVCTILISCRDQLLGAIGIFYFKCPKHPMIENVVQQP